MRETSFEHIAGNEYVTCYTAEQKWINQIRRLKKTYPDEVDIRYENPDGSLLVHLPLSWLKLKPKKQINFTEEQLAAARARLERGRQKRYQENGDDENDSERTAPE